MFVVGWIRAELAWRSCNPDGPCFDYPVYLPYEVHQSITLQGFALLPAEIVGALPESLGGNGRIISGLVTFLSVAGFWLLVGVWWDRLSIGGSFLTGRARTVVRTAIAILFPLIVLSLSVGIRGGYEGPTMTDAGFLVPLLLAVMGLIHTNDLPAALHGRGLRVVVSAAFLLVYAWADFAYLAWLR